MDAVLDPVRLRVQRRLVEGSQALGEVFVERGEIWVFWMGFDRHVGHHKAAICFRGDQRLLIENKTLTWF
jgi:hypothetical protein